MSQPKPSDRNKSLFDVYGVSEESFNKSKDILPTLDIGKLEVGSRVLLTFLDDAPKLVSIESKFQKKKVDTPVIRVLVDTIFRMEKDGRLLEIPTGMNYSLWLSSKSLAMGVLKVHQAHGTLKDIKISISIGMTDYKDFGENRCYTAQEVN